MANVIITLQIRLESPETQPDAIIEEASSILTNAEATITETKVEPLAFGLKQILITFSRDENKGAVDDLEETIGQLEGVMSTEVVGVSRSLS